MRLRENRARSHEISRQTAELAELAEHIVLRDLCGLRGCFCRRNSARADIEDARARADAGVRSPRRTACRIERRAARRRLSRRRTEEDRREAAAGPARFPFTVRVHRRNQGRRIVGRRAVRRGIGTGRVARPGTGGARAVLLGQRRSGWTGRFRRLRYRRTRQPGLRVRQLRDARCERQGRAGTAVLSRGRGSKNAIDSRAVRRSPVQSAGGATARREGDARRHRPAIAQRRRARADDVRYGDRRFGHRRREHHRRRRAGGFPRRARQDARGCAEGARLGESARRRLCDSRCQRARARSGSA